MSCGAICGRLGGAGGAEALFSAGNSLILRPNDFQPNPMQETRVTLRPQMMADRKDEPDGGPALATKTRPKTKRPPMYKVLLLNDDYTPMEFVVHVLERYFGLSHAQAFDIMLTVHKKGLAVVGVFPFEVAETKVVQVMDAARRHQHPLQCTMEKE